MADIHGQFYELSPLGWAGSTWGLRPVSQHLRVIPDYTSFRGMLVLGGNEVSPIFDNNWVTGQAQSGLYFGKTDDLCYVISMSLQLSLIILMKIHT